MQFHYATLDTCPDASGVVVVIDVCRAFTSAAYAFGAGADRILLVATVEEALALRSRFPGALIMGEVEGLPVPEMDFWNSPSQLAGEDLLSKTIIQRTSAGTQGVVRAKNAQHLLAGSFAVAGATARAVQQLQPDQVTFVITGAHPDDPRHGLEDRACAAYIIALLRGERTSPQAFLTWEQDFRAVHRLNESPEPLLSRYNQDLILCRAVDRFPFALKVKREQGLFIMEKDMANDHKP